MDAHSQVEVLRLHCEHLRTLLDRIISELTTIEHDLTTNGAPSFTLVATYLNGLNKQSETIAVEVLRLQGFVQSLDPQSPAAQDTTVEAHPSPSPSDIREK
jgi:hypothetical protein